MSAAKRVYKVMKLSAEMSKFMNVPEATRPDMQRAIWAYIKQQKLQTEQDKRAIRLDDTLRVLFPRATDPFSMYEITRYMKDHVIKEEKPAAGAQPAQTQSGSTTPASH